MNTWVQRSPSKHSTDVRAHWLSQHALLSAPNTQTHWAPSPHQLLPQGGYFLLWEECPSTPEAAAFSFAKGQNYWSLFFSVRNMDHKKKKAGSSESTGSSHKASPLKHLKTGPFEEAVRTAEPHFNQLSNSVFTGSFEEYSTHPHLDWMYRKH